MSKKRPKKGHKKDRARPAVKAADPFARLNAPRPFNRRDAAIMGMIFAGALIVRVIYFFLNKGGNPLFYHPILDSLFHHEWAEEINSGNFWGGEAFFRAPFYAYFVAFIYKISSSSMAFVVLCQHILGALTAALVYALGRQFFALRVAVTSGVLAALYWPFIYFEGELLIVALFIFVNMLLLLTIVLAMRTSRTILYLVSGLIFGLSAVTRPSILILLPALPLVFYLAEKAARRVPTGRLRDWHKQSALVIAGLAVVIVPVTIRNYIVGRDFVPIASQGGVNFYIGNNPQSNGSQAMVPGARWDLHGTYRGAIELAEQEQGRRLKPSEVSNHYFNKGIDFLLFSPGDAAPLLMKKLYLFWAGVERSNNKYIQFFWREFGLGRIPFPGFWLVGPLGLLGGVLLWRRRRELSLLYLFTVSYMVGVVVFFVNARFRLPVMPVLILFSGYALCYLYSAFRSRDASLFKTIAVLVVCVFVVDYDFLSFRGVRAFDEAVSHYELGNAYLKMNDKNSALDSFETASSINQRYPTQGFRQVAGTLSYRIGTIYWEKGLISRAIDALEEIPADDPASLQAGYILADCYVQKGRPADAAETYYRILREFPDDVQARLGLGIALRSAGDLARSKEILSELTQRPHQFRGAAYLELARTLEAGNELDAALINYNAAAQDVTQRQAANLSLARLYKKMGNKAKALEYLQALQAEFPNNREILMEINALQADG